MASNAVELTLFWTNETRIDSMLLDELRNACDLKLDALVLLKTVKFKLARLDDSGGIKMARSSLWRENGGWRD